MTDQRLEPVGWLGLGAISALILLCAGCAAPRHGLQDHDRAESEYQVRAVNPVGAIGASTASDLHNDARVRRAKNDYRSRSPNCEACGARSNITNGNRNDVHHLIPVHVAFTTGEPWLAWTTANLMTLCRNCHHRIGHRGNWRDYNPHALDQAGEIRGVHAFWILKVDDERED